MRKTGQVGSTTNVIDYRRQGFSAHDANHYDQNSGHNFRIKDTKTWQVQEAKARFSELLRASLEEGPQVVSHHGKLTAVVDVALANSFRFGR